jgi:uronate dehydrogenase
MLKHKRILVTGAAGYLGQLVRKSLSGCVAHLRLIDIAPMAPEQDGEEVVQCNLTDASAMRLAMDGVDVVVHLAASLNVDDWKQTLNVNIEGTYNVYEAARVAGVYRVIYASSHHAVGMYPVTERIGTDARLRPDSLYGVSKCFGETLAQYFWDKFGLESVCWRIGSTRAEPSEKEPREFITWISEPDFERLLIASLKAKAVACTTLYGVSKNGEVWWDNSSATLIGFKPSDDASRLDIKPTEALQDTWQGGKRAAYGLLKDSERLCAKR